MRARRPGPEDRVEVQVEARVNPKMRAIHLDHVDLMVTLEVDLAEPVFVEEVVHHYETLVVVGQQQVVRSRVQAEVKLSRAG